MKNDEVFGCARSVHFGDLENHHSEYHLLNCNNVVQVGPQHTKATRGRILKINDFRDSLLLAPYAKSGRMRHFALEHPLDLILTCKKSNG